MALNCITLVPSFAKIGHLIRKFKGEIHLHTAYIFHIYYLKEGKWKAIEGEN
jgi:hypothetical protein